MSDLSLWVTLGALGAFHGLNPAMGWLFAVSLGLQQRNRTVVLRALGPIAVGHALSIVVIVTLYAGARAIVPPRTLALASAAALVAFGLFKLVRPLAHWRWVGMRVGGSDLVLWSFLMATAHGAGLMLLPAFDAAGALAAYGPDPHLSLAGPAMSQLAPAMVGIAAHTAAMLAMISVVSLVVFDRVGLAFLRRSWFNVDILWAAALIVAGALSALMHLA